MYIEQVGREVQLEVMNKKDENRNKLHSQAKNARELKNIISQLTDEWAQLSTEYEEKKQAFEEGKKALEVEYARYKNEN